MGTLSAIVSIHLLCTSITFADDRIPRAYLLPEANNLLRLDVAIFDAVTMSESALGNLRDELEQIFGSIGVQVSWIDRAANPDHRAESLEFRAHIVPIQPTTWGFRPRAMGTVLSPEPPYTVFIFFPTIVRTVKRLESSHYGRYGADCRLVARGMARVMAHEMLHLLAPGLPHAQEGLMKRALNRNDLLLQRPLIDPTFAGLFRQRLLAANNAKRSLLGKPTESPPGRTR